MNTHTKIWSSLWITAISLSLVSAAAAQTTKAGGSAAKGKSTAAVGAGASAVKPLSEEECRGFGMAVDNAITKGDRTAFTGLIDWDALFDTVMVNMDLDDKNAPGTEVGAQERDRQ